jgi:prevent-host-death family protein
VHFGELLDSVANAGETVIVERSGQPLAAVVPIDEWRRHRTRLDDRWTQAAATMEEHWAFMRAQQEAGLLRNFDAAEVIRAGREERDEQILGAVLGREPGNPLRHQ